MSVANARENPHQAITDWYLPESNPTDGWVYPGPVRIIQSANLITVALRLGEACSEKAESQEFVIVDEGKSYRGHTIDTVGGRVFSLRAMPSSIPDFGKIGLPRGLQAVLLHERLNPGGMVIISGETGQGKSTTSAALIKARLEKFASFCLTLENPPELPLNGLHGGGGICVQTDVKAGQFGDALRGAVRCYPTQGNSMLFVGEVRDPETAGEALRIAINGHLVITSIHGADIVSSMKRMLSLAQSYQNMGESEAKSVFSSAFRMMIHQRLREGSDGERRLEAQGLFSPGGASTVANRIRQGQLEGLSTDIQQQATLLERGMIDKLLSGG